MRPDVHQTVNDILSHSVVVVMVVSFLGDVLEWESGTDIAYIGAGIALVIAALAYMQRSHGQ